MTSLPTTGNALARHEESAWENAFVERRQDRRIDPVLGAVVDVAIAYRENLGYRVAEAFLGETGVPGPVARRVLARSARQRSLVPRRRTPRVASVPVHNKEM
ncbi:MAG: hypothetical protein JWP72_1822 [Massilia sp.]|nr:hypothetical protein [Massilia sp.]MDB5792852.1 hypothetical protein [Massilia sp.]